MKQEYLNELTPEVREKMKKNVVYVGIFSVIMIFAGLTSGYYVSMGDAFWVKYPFPKPFYISTILIILSSIVLQFGISKAKKGNAKFLKLFLIISFFLGLGFAYFQFKGYGKLADTGSRPVQNIMVSQGRYGMFYEIKVNDKYLEIDGNDYKVAGKKVSEAQKKEIGAFASQFSKDLKSATLQIFNYGKYTLVYKDKNVLYENGTLLVDSLALTPVDLIRLKEFSWHLRDGRGDFFHSGTLGKDFHIYYKGKELTYKDRNLYYKKQILDTPMQLKIEDSADQASSYLYILTFLHLLHILFSLIYLLRMIIRSFSSRIEQYNYLSVRLGAIFWHFLGGLWMFLLLFLLFIH